MAEITWRKAIEIVKPYVVKINTSGGSGTGFLCAYTENKMGVYGVLQYNKSYIIFAA